jgi:hypothetical protein
LIHGIADRALAVKYLGTADRITGQAPGALAASRETATNPAVLDAFALAIIADGFTRRA